jgi:outer membrane protein TolC
MRKPILALLFSALRARAPRAEGQPSFGAGNNYGVGIEMSYELDVWGKYRSGALAATNDLFASRYHRETVRITVAANVAKAYFGLRAADALAVVLEDTKKSRTDTVALQRDRFEGGIIGEYDLRQAEAELSAIVADIARRTAVDRRFREVAGWRVGTGNVRRRALTLPLRQLPGSLTPPVNSERKRVH